MPEWVEKREVTHQSSPVATSQAAGGADSGIGFTGS